MNTLTNVLKETLFSEPEKENPPLDADLQDVDERGWTHLHFAAEEGRSDLVKILLKLGADVYKENLAFETPFSIAVKGNQMEVVKTFLDQGFDVNHPNSKGYLPILDIINERNLEILEMLSERKIPLNVPDVFGNMAIHMAAKNGFLAGILLLFEKGISPTVKGEKGETPLQMAKRGGHQAVVRLIQDCENGVKTNQLVFDYSPEVFWQSTELATSTLFSQFTYLFFWLFVCPFSYYLLLNEFVIPFQLPVSSSPYAPSLWQLFLINKPLALSVFSLPWAMVIYDHVISNEPFVVRDLVWSMETPIVVYLVLDLVLVGAFPLSASYILNYTLVWCLVAMAMVGARCYWASVTKMGS